MYYFGPFLCGIWCNKPFGFILNILLMLDKIVTFNQMWSQNNS
jgi:hypothetical protein